MKTICQALTSIITQDSCKGELSRRSNKCILTPERINNASNILFKFLHFKAIENLGQTNRKWAKIIYFDKVKSRWINHVTVPFILAVRIEKLLGPRPGDAGVAPDIIFEASYPFLTKIERNFGCTISSSHIDRFFGDQYNLDFLKRFTAFQNIFLKPRDTTLPYNDNNNILKLFQTLTINCRIITDYNSIKTKDLDNLHQLTRINPEFNFYGARDIQLGMLSNLKYLCIYNASDNDLFKLKPYFMALEELRIYNSTLTCLFLSSFTDLKKLQFFSCSKISDSLIYLSHLSLLKELTFFNCQNITDKSLEQLICFYKFTFTKTVHPDFTIYKGIR